MNKLSFAVIIIVIALTSCQNTLLSELDSFYDTNIAAKDIIPPEIDSNSYALGDLTLKDNMGTKIISWSTATHPAVDSEGNLIQPSYPSSAVNNEIYATVTFKNGTTKSFTFNVIVNPVPIDDQDSVDEAADALRVYYADGDDADNVTQDVELKTDGLHDTVISWNAASHSAVASDGSVTRPAYLSGDASGSITATITKGSASATRTFSLTVLKDAIDDATSVSEAAGSLSIGYASGDSASSVKSDVTLPSSGLYGTSVSWNTSGNSAIASDGSVTRPSFSSGDTSGNLVATITKGSESTTKTFSLTVIKLSATDTEKAQADADALAISFASGDSASSVTQNISLPSSAGSNGSTISWSASGHSYISNSGVVTTSSSDWWESLPLSKSGTVTATITNGSDSVTKNFSLTVKMSSVASAPSVGPFNNLYTQFGRRWLTFPKVHGANYISNYDVEYRAYSGGSWGSYQDAPSSAASTSGDPVKFGWAPVHLPDGHYQFRVRVTRNGVNGPWAYTSEFNPFY